MIAIRTFITRHPVPTYFALTFAISWGGVLVLIGGSDGMSGIAPGSDPRFLYVLLAMLAGPSVAGVLLTRLVYGAAGLRVFFRRMTTWRVSARWYAVALLTAPLMMSVTLFALSLASPAFVPSIFTTDDKLSLVVVSLAVGLSAGVFEEVGWTGFAIPTLRMRYGVVKTGLVVGVLWGAWHLLTNVFWAASASAGDLSVSVFLPASIVGVLVGYLPAFRLLMVWVYDRTGSVLVAMLMHVSLTASLLILNPAAITGVTLVTYSFVLAAVVWAVVAAVAIVNTRQLTRRPLHARAA